MKEKKNIKFHKFKIKKETLVYIVFLVLFSIIFFSYNITLTWDSSEYVGLSDLIGKSDMVQNWIGHRGIMFPFLIMLFRPFGVASNILLLTMSYIFYIIMTLCLFKIFEYFKDDKLFNNKDLVFYSIWMIIFVVINPLVFGYYHVLLTEFVGMTTAILTAYICFKWIQNSYSDNKKKSIIYIITLCLLTIFIYHIKQSLVPITLVAIIISGILSVIKDLRWKNFLYRLLTFIIVIVTLFGSIKLWDKVMTKANTKEITESKRVDNRLVVGLSELKYVCNNKNYTEKASRNEKLKQLEITDTETDFTIYRDRYDCYFVLYGSGDSLKSQLKFHVKVLFTAPYDVIKSYADNYWKITFSGIKQLNIMYENQAITRRVYIGDKNVEDVVSPGYEKYFEQYLIKTKQENYNLVRKVFNITLYARDFIHGFTKISLYIQPAILLFAFILFIILKKKMGNKKRKLLELIIILYAQSFGIILSYVIFGAIIDRYYIPAIISNYTADALIIMLVYKYIIEMVKKIKNKAENKA